MPVSWKDKKGRYDDPKIMSSETRIGCFRLMVHRHIHYPPDVWLFSCSHLPLDQVELSSKSLDEAKVQAVAEVKTILETALRSITDS